MRILFANEKLGWFGGVEQNVGDTAAGLRERGIECHLAWGEETSREPARYAEQFASAIRCRELGAADGEPLAAIAARLRPDCIYLHRMAEAPERAALPAGLRVVRMVHDHDLCCPRRHKYFVHNGRICRHPAGWRCWLDLAFVAKGAGGMEWRSLAAHRREMERNARLDGFLVGSEFMREELAMNGFQPEGIRVVPPVVRMAAAEPTDAAEAPHVLFVGQLIRGKGVDILLRALVRLHAEGVDFAATVIGDGNARAGLEASAEARALGDRVRFLGWVPNDALGAHYASARVLAVPARWPEPFGMIGLEAMRHARPIVGFAAGGIADWLRDGTNGLLVPEADEAAFAAALRKLLADRALATRMGRAGHALAEAEYSFGRYLDRVASALSGGGEP